MAGSVTAALLCAMLLGSQADVFSSQRSTSPVGTTQPTQGEYETWGRAFADSVATLETGAHLRFLSERRNILTAAYAHILAPLVEADGVGAVLAWLKHRIHASIALPQRSMLLAVPQPELKLRVPHILRYGNDRTIVMRTGWIELWENADWEIHRDPWQDPRHE